MQSTNKFREMLLKASAGSPFSLIDDTIKLILIDSSYVFDPDHDFVASITAGSSKELSGTGYTAGFAGSGRKTLASKTVTKSNATDKSFLDGADLTWTGLNAGTVAQFGLWKPVTNDGDSPLLAVQLVVPNYPSVGNDFVLQWPVTGILEL